MILTKTEIKWCILESMKFGPKFCVAEVVSLCFTEMLRYDMLEEAREMVYKEFDEAVWDLNQNGINLFYVGGLRDTVEGLMATI